MGFELLCVHVMIVWFCEPIDRFGLTKRKVTTIYFNQLRGGLSFSGVDFGVGINAVLVPRGIQ